MRKRTLVYMVVEWDDSHTCDPRSWDWEAMIHESGNGERVTSRGTMSIGRSMTEHDVNDLMEAIRETSDQIVTDAALFDVDDNGSGTSDESWDDLFERFPNVNTKVIRSGDDLQSFVDEVNDAIGKGVPGDHNGTNPSGYSREGCVRTNISPSDMVRDSIARPHRRPGSNDL